MIGAISARVDAVLKAEETRAIASSSSTRRRAWSNRRAPYTAPAAAFANKDIRWISCSLIPLRRRFLFVGTVEYIQDADQFTAVKHGDSDDRGMRDPFIFG